MNQSNCPSAINRENWRLFKKRAPVHFLTPRALRCRLNQAVIQLLTREECWELVTCYTENKAGWKPKLEEIEKRLLAEGLI